MKSEDIQIVNLLPSEQMKALTEGDVDAVMVWEPFATMAKQELGTNAVSWEGQSGQDEYWLLLSTAGVIEKKSRALRRFLAALASAEGFIKDNDIEAMGIVQKQLERRNLAAVWRNNRFGLGLHRPLILKMEAELEWVKSGPGTGQSDIPDVNNFVYSISFEFREPTKSNCFIRKSSMTIQRRTQITTAVLVLFVLAAISTLFWSSLQVEHAIKRTETTSQVVRNAFMLKTLMDEYLDHGGERVLRQWDKLSKTLGQILDYEVISESIERPLLEDLKKVYGSVNYLYPRVVEMRASFDQNQDSKTKKMLTSLMSLQLEQLVIAANNLSEATQLLTLNRRIRQELSCTRDLDSFVILINIYLIRKSVVRPLKLLQQRREHRRGHSSNTSLK
jgi:hypothetical protein